MNYDLEQPPETLAAGVNWREPGLPLVAARVQGWFQGLTREQSNRELQLRLEERRKERARIARDLHDTLFQGFLGVSMVLHTAVEKMPADSPSKPSLSRALILMRRVLDEGRDALWGLGSCGMESASLEKALAELGDGFNANGAQFRVSVMGRARTLLPGLQEQVYLIAREALVNAMRHSNAASIEVEIEYLPRKLRLIVRDNGSGIDRQVLRLGRESHWGLPGMRERAQKIGGQLRIWSRRGAGTEVELSVPAYMAADVPDNSPAQAPAPASA